MFELERSVKERIRKLDKRSIGKNDTLDAMCLCMEAFKGLSVKRAPSKYIEVQLVHRYKRRCALCINRLAECAMGGGGSERGWQQQLSLVPH